ncbi:hypothetical protein [Nocardia sp. NBC_01388]|uniref:hypothetical protein n=1 Tax=Nocardia sp. NBC_01388 TaxID=2903596 RepID=UPI00324C914F
MASYEHREVQRTRYEWRVPGATYGGWGSAVAEVHKAIAAAETRYREVMGKDPTHDDWLRVWAEDDDIVLWFEYQESDR